MCFAGEACVRNPPPTIQRAPKNARPNSQPHPIAQRPNSALFFGLGTVVIEQSAGSYLPGTKITDVRIQGFIVFLGL
jgi:hypothetical protein